MLVQEQVAHLAKPLSVVIHSTPKSFTYVLDPTFFAGQESITLVCWASDRPLLLVAIYVLIIKKTQRWTNN